MISRWGKRLILVVVVLVAAIFVWLVFNGVIGGEEDPGSGDGPVPAERR